MARRDPSRSGSFAPPRPAGRRLRVIAVAVVGVLLGAVVVGWAIDSRANDGKVARGVTFDERSVSGLSPAELRATVAEVAASWAAVPVSVTSPKGKLDTTLGALGITVDADKASEAALAAGRDTFVLLRPFAWVRSLLAPRPVAVAFTLDEATGARALAPLEQQNHADPTEPTLNATADKVVPVAGAAGTTIDVTDVLNRARSAASAGQRPITVEAKAVPLAPKYSDKDAQHLADQANDLTKKSVSIYLTDKSIKVDSRMLRTWLKLAPTPQGLDIQVDQAKVETDVPKLLGRVGTPVVQLHFDLGADGKPAIVEGTPGSQCCTPESVQQIPAALKAGRQRVDLQLRTVAPDHDRAWAEKLAVNEKVAEFTTPHPCCEARVNNIHRIADTVRGVVVAPGETFSVNGFVGQRTKEKGYVEAPVIYSGTHDTDVGGGVSQFATTLFNAAFFAGLDIPAYQMHSLYISRYPYGREATISWDKPDLKIRNNTPYGIMIWTSYTDTSLTVSIYSTPFAKGDQTNQTKEPKGPCTKVVTERTRTFFADNHTETDSFSGLYQPADGVTC